MDTCKIRMLILESVLERFVFLFTVNNLEKEEGKRVYSIDNANAII